MIPSSDALRTFVGLTYGFILLRIFQALLRTFGDLLDSSHGVLRVLAPLCTRNHPFERYIHDGVLFAAILLVSFLMYFVLIDAITQRSGIAYAVRHFFTDLIVAFGFFSVVEKLLCMEESHYRDFGYLWFGLMAVYFIMLVRFALPTAWVGEPSEREKVVRLRALAISWCLISLAVCAMGLHLELRMFMAQRTVEVLTYVASGLLIGAIGLYARVYVVRRIVVPSGYLVALLALGVLGIIVVHRYLAYEALLEWVIQVRHRISMAWILLVVSTGVCAFTIVFRLDQSAVPEMLRATRAFGRAFIQFLGLSKEPSG